MDDGRCAAIVYRLSSIVRPIFMCRRFAILAQLLADSSLIRVCEGNSKHFIAFLSFPQVNIRFGGPCSSHYGAASFG
jgi:hypothetical protein